MSKRASAEEKAAKARDIETSAEWDRILLARIAQENREAFEELFDRLAPVVLDYVGAMLRDHSLAEEILQEVFLRLWVEAHRYKPGSAPLVWIIVMARSRALDHLRREASQKRREAAFHGEPSPREPIGTARLELPGVSGGGCGAPWTCCLRSSGPA